MKLEDIELVYWNLHCTDDIRRFKGPNGFYILYSHKTKKPYLMLYRYGKYSCWFSESGHWFHESELYRFLYSHIENLVKKK